MKQLYTLLILLIPFVGFGQKKNLPSNYSLEKYTPKSILQIGNMCEAYAISTIRTIILAKNEENTNPIWINENRFSPFFIYYMNLGYNNSRCNKGTLSNYEIGNNGEIQGYQGLLQFLKDYGITKMSDVESKKYYPNTDLKLWKCYPKDSLGLLQDLIKAKEFRIDTFQFIGSSTKKVGEIGIYKIKSNLSEGIPSIINVSIRGGDKWGHKHHGKS